MKNCLRNRVECPPDPPTGRVRMVLEMEVGTDGCRRVTKSYIIKQDVRINCECSEHFFLRYFEIKRMF